MKRLLAILFGLTLTVGILPETHAQNPRQDPGLPKVDFQMGPIQPVGQGLAIRVTNGGFVRSPGTTVSVAIYDSQSRQLLTTKSLNVPPMQPNQTRRLIVVPPSPGQSILVRATIDPGNRVPETNERNNQIASRH